MSCMKCGREAVGEQAFCAECLAEMEKYPVRPGVVVRLPRCREEATMKKHHTRRKSSPGPEEQLKSMKRLIRVLLATLFVSTVLLVAAGYFAVIHLMETDPVFLPGQNYSSMVDTGETVPE